MKTLNKLRNPKRSDPTRTQTLRRNTEQEIRRRFNIVKKKIYELIVEEDAFGLREVRNSRWAFRSSDQQLHLFKAWLQSTLAVDVLDIDSIEEDRYWKAFVEQGYRKGAGRAFTDVRKPGLAASQEEINFYNGTRQEFLQSAFSRPESVNKVKLLASRTFTELENVSQDMATKLSRNLAEGLVQGDNPRTIARTLVKDLGVGVSRSERIARTEIVRAHAEGQLDAMEQLGVQEIGVMVEWSTAGDDRVCPLCQALSNIVVRVDKAHGLIPRHPNCRCAFIPANVGELSKSQKRSKAAVRQARDKSLRLEIPKKSKRSLKRQKELSSWRGADLVPDSPLKKIVPTVPKPKPKPSPKKTVEKKVVNKATKKITKQPLKDNRPILQRLDDHEELNDLQQRLAKGKFNSADNDYVLESLYNELEERLDIADEDIQDLLSRETDLKLFFRKKQISQSKYIADKKKVREEITKITLWKRDITKEMEGKIAALKNDPADLLKLPSDRKTKVDWEVKGPKFNSIAERKLAQAKKFIEDTVDNSIFDEPLKSVPVHKHGSRFRAHHIPEYYKKRWPHETSRQYRPGIHLRRDPNIKTIVHEFGHRIEEKAPRIKELAQEFRRARINKSGTPDEKLQKIFPKNKYKNFEVGNKDDFEKLFGKGETASYYAGKHYPQLDGETEIISMGLEILYQDPAGFALKDPEYFKFIVGVVRGIL